jgi:hypothetical protein
MGYMIKKLYNLAKNKTIKSILVASLVIAVSLAFVYSLGFSTNWAMFDNLGPANLETGVRSYAFPFQIEAQRINFAIFTFSLIALIFTILLIVFKVTSVKRLNIFHFAFIIVIFVCMLLFLKFLAVDVKNLKELYTTEFASASDFDPSTFVDSNGLTVDDPGFNFAEYQEISRYWMWFGSSASEYSLAVFDIGTFVFIFEIVGVIVFSLYLVVYSGFNYLSKTTDTILNLYIKERNSLGKDGYNNRKKEILEARKKYVSTLEKVIQFKKEEIKKINKQSSDYKQLCFQLRNLKNMKLANYDNALNIVAFWR